MLSVLPKIMPRSLSRFALNTLRNVSYTPFARKFPNATEHQRRWLLNRIRLGESTEFGRDHGFGEIRSLQDFQQRVPIRGYDYFEPYIQSVAAGKTSALIPEQEKLVQFTITTGSTGIPKLNPVTNTWLREYRQAWAAWGLKLFCDHPQHSGSRMLQMAGTWDMGTTPGGYQISMVSALLARMQNPLLKPFYLIPEIVNTIPDPVARHYVALRLSIAEDVGWILLMNPGTLIRLAEIGHSHADTLLKDLRDGTLSRAFDIPEDVREYLQRSHLAARPAAVQRLAQLAATRGRLLPIDYWNKPVIGCWTGGTAGFQSRYVPEYFGNAPMRDMGLVTSEGRHTIPIEDATPAGVPSIESGFYEFLPIEEADSADPIALEGHELTPGKRYRLLMTTSAGYYRFDIGDIVECTGFVGQLPLLAFIQKSARVGDLEGEKVTEHQVVEAAHAAAERLGIQLGLITAVPRRLQHEQPRYDFAVETSDFPDRLSAQQFLKHLDGELAQINFLWRARRREGVLQSPHLLLLKEGEWSRCIAEEVKRRGTGDYQYKHPGLVTDEAWIQSLHVQTTLTNNFTHGTQEV